MSNEPVLTDSALKRIANADISGEHSLMARELLCLRSSQPAWHPKPTCPGLWVCSSGGSVMARPETIAVWREMAGFQWYGPIPEPDKKGDVK